MQIHLGASLDRPPGPKYTSALAFAELRFPSSRPKPQTLARFRESVGEDFRASIMAPKSCTEGESGSFKMDATLLEGLDWLGRAASAAKASALVIPTQRALSTGQRDRDKLAAYFDALRERAEGVELVWFPGGLWSLELAAPEAERLGVTLALDPLDEDFIPGGRLAYLRLTAFGSRPRISPGMFHEVLEKLEDHPAEEAYVAIHSERSVREATTLLTMLTEPE